MKPEGGVISNKSVSFAPPRAEESLDPSSAKEPSQKRRRFAVPTPSRRRVAVVDYEFEVSGKVGEDDMRNCVEGGTAWAEVPEQFRAVAKSDKAQFDFRIASFQAVAQFTVLDDASAADVLAFEQYLLDECSSSFEELATAKLNETAEPRVKVSKELSQKFVKVRRLFLCFCTTDSGTNVNMHVEHA